MASAEKYVVRDAHRTLTKAARRADAFRVATLLGPKYRV